MTAACICRPGDPEGWYREDCPVHGREAQDERNDYLLLQPPEE